MSILYSFESDNVDWEELKSTLAKDNFDNGRTPKQYQTSFENSYAVCFAYYNDNIIGKARVLSDGVCNAYIVDVWTQSKYRKQGIATTIMKKLFDKLPGQHVYLFTDDATDFYEKLGFERQDIGMGRVEGKWLDNNS